jgi:hypothetical protein
MQNSMTRSTPADATAYPVASEKCSPPSRTHSSRVSRQRDAFWNAREATTNRRPRLLHSRASANPRGVVSYCTGDPAPRLRVAARGPHGALGRRCRSDEASSFHTTRFFARVVQQRTPSAAGEARRRACPPRIDCRPLDRSTSRSPCAIDDASPLALSASAAERRRPDLTDHSFGPDNQEAFHARVVAFHLRREEVR